MGVSSVSMKAVRRQRGVNVSEWVSLMSLGCGGKFGRVTGYIYCNLKGLGRSLCLLCTVCRAVIYNDTT